MSAPPAHLSNLFADVQTDGANERFDTLLESAGIRIERIVSHGHASPPDFWYDQPLAEWVVVIRGCARLRFEDEPADRELQAGDHVHIAPRRRHRVTWTDPEQPTLWLAVHFAESPSPPPLPTVP